MWCSGDIAESQKTGGSPWHDKHQIRQSQSFATSAPQGQNPLTKFNNSRTTKVFYTFFALVEFPCDLWDEQLDFGRQLRPHETHKGKKSIYYHIVNHFARVLLNFLKGILLFWCSSDFGVSSPPRTPRGAAALSVPKVT